MTNKKLLGLATLLIGIGLIGVFITGFDRNALDSGTEYEQSWSFPAADIHEISVMSSYRITIDLVESQTGHSYVKLEVFDLNGRRVSTLVDGWRSTGRHEATFDASNLASGIYLYRIQAAGEVVSGKMAFIK